MNQTSRFRETQELRELIGRGLPALHHGHVSMLLTVLTVFRLKHGVTSFSELGQLGQMLKGSNLGAEGQSRKANSFRYITYLLWVALGVHLKVK